MVVEVMVVQVDMLNLVNQLVVGNNKMEDTSASTLIGMAPFCPSHAVMPHFFGYTYGEEKGPMEMDDGDDKDVEEDGEEKDNDNDDEDGENNRVEDEDEEGEEFEEGEEDEECEEDEEDEEDKELKKFKIPKIPPPLTRLFNNRTVDFFGIENWESALISRGIFGRFKANHEAHNIIASSQKKFMTTLKGAWDLGGSWTNPTNVKKRKLAYLALSKYAMACWKHAEWTNKSNKVNYVKEKVATQLAAKAF